jgi:hypothetical protein
MAVGLPLCAPTDADHRDHSVRLAQRLAVTRVRCNDALTQRNRAETANVFGTTRAHPNLSALARRQNRTSLQYRMSGGLKLPRQLNRFEIGLVAT